jgi:uncharacterized protein (TIGR03032 family)
VFRPVASRGFPSWLRENRVSLAISTYEVGKILLIGTDPQGRFVIFERTLDRCMGLHAAGDTLFAATRTRIVRFRDAGGDDTWDRKYLPRVAWYTGDVDAHDIGLDSGGHPLLVATRFNCIGRTSIDRSFEPVWWPRFLTGPIDGDRCHLNGLATVGGEPAIVTMAAPSDAPDGWRRNRFGTGQVVDARTHEVLAGGLAMPHSPRIVDGRVWFLEAARGALCTLERGRVDRICQLPGFARGLAFYGGYAVVGLSVPRTNLSLHDTPVALEHKARGMPLLCGIAVVDVGSGAIAHLLAFEGEFVREVYDVAVLPDTLRPWAAGFQGDELTREVDLG